MPWIAENTTYRWFCLANVEVPALSQGSLTLGNFRTPRRVTVHEERYQFFALWLIESWWIRLAKLLGFMLTIQSLTT